MMLVVIVPASEKLVREAAERVGAAATTPVVLPAKQRVQSHGLLITAQESAQGYT